MSKLIIVIVVGIIRLIYTRYSIRKYANNLVEAFDTHPPLLDSETGIWTINILKAEKSPLQLHMHLVNKNPIDKTKMHPTSLEIQYGIDTKKAVKENLEGFRKVALLAIKSTSKL